MSGVIVDVQGVQSSAHGERGIGRYLTGLARELERRHPELVASFLLNRDLPAPAALEPLATSGRLTYTGRALLPDSSAFHMGSPIELEVDFERLWPAEVRRLPLLVTLYDLIPEVFPDHYLGDAAFRRRYRTRLQLLRHADRILAISHSTARDAVERLGLPADRVVTVGAGVSEYFRPPTRRDDAVTAVATRLPLVRPGFVLYTGGIEYRKNIERLLIGYASLPKRLRHDHQLVIVCRVVPDAQRVLDARLNELGLSEQVVFTGFVAESDLILLYQAAELSIFPSLYEGFGFPVAEAMACGAPVLASRTSALVELVDDDAALFDPARPEAIATAVRNALGDAELRARLRERGLDRRWRWPAVADRTAEIYREVGRLRPRRIRPRVAFVSPLPPQMSGVADYSYRLLDELRKLADVDAFADPPRGAAEALGDYRVHAIRSFENVERACGGYDAVLACLGNSEHHTETLTLLRHRPVTVLAHDVRLTGLYGWISRARRRHESRSFHEVLHDMYRDRLPPDLGEHGWLDVTDAERYGIVMAREAIARSTRFLVHSSYAAQLARLDADQADVGKIEVVPFGYPNPEELRNGPPDPATVATFGVVAPVKQTQRIVEAFALVATRRSEARLAIVGPASNAEVRRIQEAASRLGVEERVHVTREVPQKQFREWLGRATVAVQLRAASNGETSATVAECLAAGVPTVATALGSTRELPGDAYVAVDRDVSAAELAAEIEALLDDDVRRRALSTRGRTYAEANSFARVARALIEVLELPNPGLGAPARTGRGLG